MSQIPVYNAEGVVKLTLKGDDMDVINYGDGPGLGGRGGGGGES